MLLYFFTLGELPGHGEGLRVEASVHQLFVEDKNETPQSIVSSHDAIL